MFKYLTVDAIIIHVIMSVAAFFGKLLIVTSLLFHAFLLFQDKATQKTFDTRLVQSLQNCKIITQ